MESKKIYPVLIFNLNIFQIINISTVFTTSRYSYRSQGVCAFDSSFPAHLNSFLSVCFTSLCIH